MTGGQHAAVVVHDVNGNHTAAKIVDFDESVWWGKCTRGEVRARACQRKECSRSPPAQAGGPSLGRGVRGAEGGP